MTRFSITIAVAATALMTGTAAGAGAGAAQGGYQWNPSRATDPSAVASQISEQVRSAHAQALYLQQTGETRAGAQAVHATGGVFAGHVKAYSL